MAKLTAPLMSFGARGQLAKALVYFPWKGVDAVRSYVIPANPRTADQLTQRARMTAAVAEFHGALYNAFDMEAFNRWANVLAGSMSGFNAMIRNHIAENILGNTWERINQASNMAPTDTTIATAIQKGAGGNAPTIRWGVSKTSMPNNDAMTDAGGGTWTHTIPGLIASTLYYITFDVGASAADWGRLGIYAQRTTA